MLRTIDPNDQLNRHEKVGGGRLDCDVRLRLDRLIGTHEAKDMLSPRAGTAGTAGMYVKNGQRLTFDDSRTTDAPARACFKFDDCPARELVLAAPP